MTTRTLTTVLLDGKPIVDVVPLRDGGNAIQIHDPRVTVEDSTTDDGMEIRQ